MSSPEGGARPILRAALDPTVSSGEYYAPMFSIWGPATFGIQPKQAKDAVISTNVWKELILATGVEY